MKSSKRVREAQSLHQAFLAKFQKLRVPIPQEEFHLFETAAGEEHTVAVIRSYLLTEPQRIWLFQRNISIEDILNGRVEGGLPEVAALFRDWNEKLGGEYFHEY